MMGPLARRIVSAAEKDAETVEAVFSAARRQATVDGGRWLEAG